MVNGLDHKGLELTHPGTSGLFIFHESRTFIENSPLMITTFLTNSFRQTIMTDCSIKANLVFVETVIALNSKLLSDTDKFDRLRNRIKTKAKDPSFQFNPHAHEVFEVHIPAFIKYQIEQKRLECIKNMKQLFKRSLVDMNEEELIAIFRETRVDEVLDD